MSDSGRRGVPLSVRIPPGWLAAAVLFILAIGTGCSRSDPEEAGVRAFENGDIRGAIERLERCVRDHPQKTRARNYLGRAYAAHRDYEKAHRAFAEYRQREPSLSDGYYYDADAYLEEGRARLARQDATKALDLLDAGADLITQLVKKQPNNDEAFELEATIHLNQFLAHSLNCRQLLADGFGPDESAKIERALHSAIYGDNFKNDLNDVLAELQTRDFAGIGAFAADAQSAAKAFEGTKSAVQQAITLDLDQSLSTAHLGLAQLYAAVGQKENAKEACKRLLEIPDHGKPDELTRIRRDKSRARFLLADLLTGRKKDDADKGTKSDKKPEKREARDADESEAPRKATAKANKPGKKEIQDKERHANLQEAIRHMNDVLESKGVLKSDAIEAHVRLCRYYFESNELEAMSAEAKALHKLDADNPAGNLFRGIEAERTGRADRIDQAVEWIRQGLTGPFADFSDGYLALARALSKQPGKEDAAVTAVSRCLRSDPENREARILRADLYSRIGWFHDAQAEVESLLAIHPDDLALQAKLRSFEERRFDRPPGSPAIQSIDDAKGVLARDRSQSWARRRLVELLLESGASGKGGDASASTGDSDDPTSTSPNDSKRGVYAEALKEARVLLEANPDSYVAERLYGRALVATRDPRRAEKSFAQAIALQPLLPDCYGDLGSVLIQVGKFSRGVAQLRAGLRRDPTSEPLSVALARLYASKGHPPRAKKTIEALPVQGERSTDVQCLLGEIAIADGNLDQAQEIFRKLLEKAPELPLPRFGLARVYSLRHDPEAVPALKYFLQNSVGKIDLLPQREEALRMLLREHLAAGHVDDVIATARQLQREGDHGSAPAVFARFFFDRGDYPIALAHCRYGLAGTSDLGELHLIWGDVADRIGNRRKALEEWTAAIASDPTLTEARLKIAEAHRLAGQSRAASQAYKKTLNLDFDEPAVYRGIALVLPDELRKGVLKRFAQIEKRLDKKGPIFGLDALRCRLALMAGDQVYEILGARFVVHPADWLASEVPASLTGDERAALALLRFAAKDWNGVESAFEPAAAFVSDPMRAQCLALVAIEQKDYARAAAACQAQLESPANPFALDPDDGAVGIQGARQDFRGGRAVQATLACIRLLQGRPEDAVALAQQTSDGDERRDFASFLRLLAANESIATDAATRFARALAFRSSPFTVGLAVREAQALQRLVPGHPLPYLLLANLEIERGNRPLAGKLLGEAIVRNRDHAPSYVRRAYLAAEAGRIKDAWGSLVQAADSCAESADVQAALGALAAKARKQGLIAKAPVTYFKSAVEIAEREGASAPILTSLHRSLGRALQSAGDLDGAIEQLREARRLAPSDRRTSLQLVTALFRKMGSSKSDASPGLLDVPSRPPIEEIELVANDLVRDFPTRPEGSLVLARVRENQGDFEEARAVLERCLRDIDPFYVHGRLELMRVLERLGDDAAKALESEERTIVMLHPGKADVHAKLAERATKQNALAEAETHLREALLFRPLDRGLISDFLKTALARKDWKEANRLIDKARESFPADGEIRFLVAETFHRQGRESEALREYLEAETLLPTDPRIHVGLAEVYAERELPALARDEAQRALDLDPNCERAREILKSVGPGTVPGPNPKARRNRGGGAKPGGERAKKSDDDSGDGR
ncbi:MAG: tetratricopeptide repeat protein [Planctomycetes bacterium]|nr:tetratricopeptide repeat protein [Planctomycetota bacterium]MBI3845888.1 tetratricopeptide repeat protein [Planctomycetota bacterium]